MLLGMKLDIGYADREDYRRLFGRRDVLTFLRDLGFEAVETPVGLETADHALIEHAQTCAAAGLRVSLHPYSEQTPANAALFAAEDDNPCRRLHERFLTAGDRIANFQRSATVINIHGAAHSEVPRSQQLQRSVQFFTWCRRWCEDRPETVRVVAELQISPNPNERVQRIGDRYDELLDLIRPSGTGACWDLGHAVMNSRRFGYELEPPAELLSRVAHVHCHDVHQSDHQPLVFGNVPWRHFLGQAAEAGFDGTVILEVPPEHFLAAGGLDSLIESAGALRQALTALSSATGPY